MKTLSHEAFDALRTSAQEWALFDVREAAQADELRLEPDRRRWLRQKGAPLECGC